MKDKWCGGCNDTTKQTDTGKTYLGKPITKCSVCEAENVELDEPLF